MLVGHPLHAGGGSGGAWEDQEKKGLDQTSSGLGALTDVLILCHSLALSS